MTNRSKTTQRLIISVAIISMITVTLGFAATEQMKQQAINDGLVWLVSQQTVSGDEGYWSYANNGTLANTAAIALAYIEEGYLPGEDLVIDEVNYGDVVGRAIRYILNRAEFDSRFGVETAGYERYAEDYDNDGVYDDGNDLAIYFNPGASNRNLYTTGICIPVVFALGRAYGENVTIDWGSAAVQGRTYAEVMQDLVDWIVFAQIEPNQGNFRGGWRYDANWDSADNSTAQWGALPLLYADDWGLATPEFVYAELELWVNYIQNPNGGSGYDSPTYLVNISKTGGLLLELAAIGATIDDARVQNALSFIDSRWNTGVNGWDGNLNNAYAMWALYKGLRSYGLSDKFDSAGHEVYYGFGVPSAPGGFIIGNEGDTAVSEPGDWFSHYCDYLVDLQNANGSWSGASSWTGSLATGWYINILNASPSPLHPADPDVQIVTTFDGECPWYGTELNHDIRYWFGTPGFPDPDVLPAEDVTLTVILSPNTDLVDYSPGFVPAGDDTLILEAGTVPDGEERFAWIITEVNAGVAPLTELITEVTISASNVDPERWDTDESRVNTCPIYCVNARLGEVDFNGDDLHLTVPVILEGVPPLEDIYAVDLGFTYNSEYLVVNDVTYAGTVLEGLGWSQLWSEPQPGEFRLGLAGATALPDDGVLVYLELDLLPEAPCSACDTFVLDLLLNEGNPCVLVAEADEWCLPQATTTGQITFWGCGELANDHPPIPGVEVAIEGEGVSAVYTTGADGMFSLEGCHEECYLLTPSKPAGETEGISVLDAAVVLRHVVGLDDLLACPIAPMEMQDGSFCPEEEIIAQQLAADVTGNGEIHSFDAAMILKYIVGADLPDSVLVGEWEFFCAERTVCLMDDVVPGMDFVGLLYGDVTGSYGLMGAPTPLITSVASVRVGSASGTPGELVDVPVLVDGADGFYGITLDLRAQDDLLVTEAVIPGQLAQNRLLEWNVVDGVMSLAVAGTTPITGSDVLCTVRYRVAEDAIVPQIVVAASDVYVDEQVQPLATEDGVIALSGVGVEHDDLPTAYALHDAVPNPFNPQTRIAFDVPTGGARVTIRVYDVTGRLVRILHDGVLPAGQHDALWSGNDDTGRRVASGTYFCRMEAGSFVATRSMTLVK